MKQSDSDNLQNYRNFVFGSLDPYEATTRSCEEFAILLLFMLWRSDPLFNISDAKAVIPVVILFALIRLGNLDSMTFVTVFLSVVIPFLSLY